MKRISVLLWLVVLAAGSVWSQNKVLSLDGDGDYVEIQNSDSLNVKSTATIEAWVKADRLSNQDHVIFDNMWFHDLGGYQLIRRGASTTFDLTISDGETWRSMVERAEANEFVMPNTQPETYLWYHLFGHYPH